MIEYEKCKVSDVQNVTPQFTCAPMARPVVRARKVERKRSKAWAWTVAVLLLAAFVCHDGEEALDAHDRCQDMVAQGAWPAEVCE